MTIRPASRSAATIAGPGLEPVEALERAGAVITPRSSMIGEPGRSWRRPISKSFGSWAGVTLTAPVPKAGSTCASATIGIARPVSGSSTVVPTRWLVPLVVGVDRHGGVAEHGLGSCRGDDDAVVSVAVADRDELAVVVGVVDLDVGQRGEAARAPVDDPLGPVDQPVVVQPLEDRLDGPGQPLVHREPLAGPVHAVAEPAHLGQDPAAVLGLPLPDPLHERLAAEVVPGQARPWPARARRRSGWRCPRGPCPAARACGSPASGGGGRGRRSACGRARGRCAGAGYVRRREDDGEARRRSRLSWASGVK